MSSIAFNEEDYYNYSKLLSYNKVRNLILSNRGDGKTFGAKKLCIDRFLKTGNQFVYIRRRENEFKHIKNFFTDIQYLYPNHSFYTKPGRFYIDNKLAGYNIPLATAYNYKSNNFDKVFYIVFDEFIAANNVRQYLKDEIDLFYDLIETIGRNRDIRIIMCANSVSQNNPYFIEWGIHMKYNQRFWVGDDIVVEKYVNKQFTEKKKLTAVGRMISGTKYSQYSIDNEWLQTVDNNFIAPMTGICKPICEIDYMGHKYSVYKRYSDNIIFFTNTKSVPDSIDKYALTTEDHNLNYTFIKAPNTSNFLGTLYKLYTLGFVRFVNINDKIAFIEVMQI